MAVIRWKKLRGYYCDTLEELHTTYTVAPSAFRNAEIPDAD